MPALGAAGLLGQRATDGGAERLENLLSTVLRPDPRAQQGLAPGSLGGALPGLSQPLEGTVLAAGSQLALSALPALACCLLLGGISGALQLPSTPPMVSSYLE